MTRPKESARRRGAQRAAGPVRSGAGPSAGFLVFLGACSAWAAAAALLPPKPYGAALSPHAIHHIAAARSLLAGEGFTSFDGGPHTLYPLLLPLVLAAAGRLGPDPLHLAGPLNAAFFALSVFFVGRFLAGRLESRFLRFCSPLAAALSLPLGYFSSFAMSEALFVLLTILALLRTDDYLAGGGRRPLAGAAVFGALAWQTRYIGVAVPAAVVLALLFGPGGVGTRPRIRAAALAAVTAAAPMGLLLGRNLLVVGAPTGHYLLSRVEYPAGQILREIAVGFAWWTWIEAGILPGFALLSCAVAVPASAFLLRSAISRPSVRTPVPAARSPGKTAVSPARPAPPARPGGGSRGGDHRRTVAVFGGFSAVYLTLLVFALSTGHSLVGFDSRFLVPVYLPLLVSGAVLLDRLYRRERMRPSERRRSGNPFFRRLAGSSGLTGPALVSMAALGLWTLAQIPPGARAVAGGDAPDAPAYIRPDTDYASDRWMNSPTVGFLRTDPLDAAAGPIYSNLPWLVYLLETRGRGPILRLPPHRPGLQGPPPSPEGVEPPGSRDRRRPRPRDALRRWLRSAPEGAPIVWFRAPLPSRSLDFGPAALRVTPGVEPVAEFEDGAVFVVNPGYAAATNRYEAALERIRSGAAGPPAARSAFDLYLEDRAMLYLREPCSPEDEAVRGLFFVETAPPEATPPAARRPPDASSAGAGFVFPFVEHGAYLAPDASGAGGSDGREDPGAETCLLVVPLEAGAGRPVRAGGLARDHRETWAVEIPPPGTAAR